MPSHILHVKIPPSGKYMPSHILHVISKIPPSLANTCQVTSYTSKSHPLWQVHASVTSYTSYQNPTLSGKYMQRHILHVISRSHPLWQVHAKSHLTRHIKYPNLSGKYMQLSHHMQPLTTTALQIDDMRPHREKTWKNQLIRSTHRWPKRRSRSMVSYIWRMNHSLRVMVYEA